MTDGPTLPLDNAILFGGATFDAAQERLIISDSPASSMLREVVEGPGATTFGYLLELQPTSTSNALLYQLAADLFRRGYPGVGYEVRRAADDLEALSRHER